MKLNFTVFLTFFVEVLFISQIEYQYYLLVWCYCVYHV